MKVFVGSSKESESLMREIAGWLGEAGLTVIRWSDAFDPGVVALHRLLDVLDDVDAAVMVFSPDDRTEVRREVAFRPRDNVVFEFGLFVGRLGPTRAIICSARHEDNGHARRPSDLGGLTFVDVTDRASGRDRVISWAQRLDPRTPPLGGVVRSSDSFPIDVFCERLRTARVVRILQTFIPTAAHLSRLQPLLEAALLRGCSVQVLLCDHRSKATDIRQLALLPFEVTVTNAIAENVRAFGAIYSALASRGPRSDGDPIGQLDVRVYATLPSLTLYQTDEEMIVGSYLHGTLAIHGPHLHVRGAQAVWGRTLKEEFDRVWKGSRPVDLGDPDVWLRQ